MHMSDDLVGKQPKVLIPEVKLQSRISELAQEINHDYRGREVTAICILKGSFIFFSDIIRKLDLPLSCEFLGVQNYGNRNVTSGEVKVTLDINEPLENKHVIVFEDVIDTGLTIQYIMNALRARKPATIKSCALLLKTENLRTEVDADYLGFKIAKEFVVGYGIDHMSKYRGLPYIGYLEHDH